jgi:hypothetical protein
MGIRGEVFSTKVSLLSRTYFFNIKENRKGSLYLNLVESKNKEGSGFERQSIILFEEDLQEFLKGFDEALRFMEKSIRDKKRFGDGEKHSSAKIPGKKTFTHKTFKEKGDSPSGDQRDFKGKSTERVKRAVVKAKYE